MRLYFAYGSNMNKRQIKERCGSGAKFLKKAYLPNYKFVYDGYSYKWNGAVANVIPLKGEVVWGVLYEITKECEDKLDGHEGLGVSYFKIDVIVYDENGNSHKAFLYLREPREPGKPSLEYLETIIEGAREAGLPEDYIKKYLEVL